MIFFEMASTVFVAHLVSDFIKGTAFILQQSLGDLHPDALLIGQLGFTGGMFEPSLHGTTAHAAFTGQAFIIEVLVEIILDPFRMESI